ncbi:hypothetical protein Aca07nite_71920 [Actinoplanes capillaceus]|uniref:DUF4396 domain-containing protein n=1 Tax=Actinoplanes campanulatus TaxID=113559 RepID=A0ABQ3WUI1_9ACTN|nr:DUF4396 domain-containing protein [Actinoplanes capillaceus]GID49917.1 hypothetical protein Aca07nite_71920 [Actinoplanes capillaceus]
MLDDFGLTGRAIGEVRGPIVGTALGWHNAATVVRSVAMEVVFGYGLTMRSVLRAGVDFRRASKIALAADTVSSRSWSCSISRGKGHAVVQQFHPAP